VEKSTMSAANESQGLKIAVSAFITLTVLLAATSYFLYASIATAEARLEVERDARQLAKRAATLAVSQYDEMRARVGTKAVEFDAAKEEITADFKKVEDRLNDVMRAVNAALRTAEQNGAKGPELEDARLKVQKAIASYRDEPNKNYISSLGRLTELTENLALLTTQLSLKYVDARKSLEAATSSPKGQKDEGPRTKD
jgi:hypothetical protein